MHRSSEMYMFEGDYRRKPEQCLSGASVATERNELLQHLRQQRQKREECRKRMKCTVLIQAYARGYLTRKYVKSDERVSFDSILQECDRKKAMNEKTLSLLVKKLLFFYAGEEDDNRLVVISQHILREQQKIIKLTDSAGSPWYWHLQRLLNLNLKQILSSVKSNSTESIAVSLRMLEIFTSMDVIQEILGKEKGERFLARLFSYLIRKNYFQSLKFLIDEKTPPLLSESTKAPTPLVGCLFELLTRPLQLANTMSQEEFNVLLRHLCQYVLSPKLTEAIKLFVIPALVELPMFPFCKVLEFLKDVRLSEEKLQYDLFSTSMLFILLSLERRHFCELISVRIVSCVPVQYAH